MSATQPTTILPSTTGAPRHGALTEICMSNGESKLDANFKIGTQCTHIH